MTKLTALLLAVIWFPIPSFAWGPKGHRIVADVAWAHLSATAQQHVQELLGNDDLATVSTWADEIRTQRPETYGWHFVDIPRNSSGFSEPRDCYKPDEKHVYATNDHANCVVDRISIFQGVLANKNARWSERVEALKFLVHFVADVHQPLHAIGEARGGNDIHVSAFGSPECDGRPCNLHLVWDVGLIEHTRRSDEDYVLHLDRLISRRNLQRGVRGTPADWANESFHLAQKVWLNDGAFVDEAYYRENIGSLDEMLALAGLRLAALLNDALGK
jgi:nuclease S1